MVFDKCDEDSVGGGTISFEEESIVAEELAAGSTCE